MLKTNIVNEVSKNKIFLKKERIKTNQYQKNIFNLNIREKKKLLTKES